MVEINDKFSGIKEKSLGAEALCTYPPFSIIFILLRFYNSFPCFYKVGGCVS